MHFLDQKAHGNFPLAFFFSHLFLHKRHHPKITKEHEAKWIYITEVHDDKLYRDVVYQPEADMKGSLDHWKYVSIIFVLLTKLPINDFF